MNIKTVLKSSVAAAALFAIAAPAANAEIKSGNKNSLTMSGEVVRILWHADDGVSVARDPTGAGNGTVPSLNFTAVPEPISNRAERTAERPFSVVVRFSRHQEEASS